MTTKNPYATELRAKKDDHGGVSLHLKWRRYIANTRLSTSRHAPRLGAGFEIDWAGGFTHVDLLFVHCHVFLGRWE